MIDSEMLDSTVCNYIVRAYSEETGETVYEYIGNDYNEAKNAFLRQLQHLHLTKEINKDATLLFEDVYEDKILDSYNTLNDA